jgi:hypothetical protein
MHLRWKTGLTLEEFEESWREFFLHPIIYIDAHEVEADEVFLPDESGHHQIGRLSAICARNGDGFGNCQLEGLFAASHA